MKPSMLKAWLQLVCCSSLREAMYLQHAALAGPVATPRGRDLPRAAACLDAANRPCAAGG